MRLLLFLGGGWEASGGFGGRRLWMLLGRWLVVWGGGSGCGSGLMLGF